MIYEIQPHSNYDIQPFSLPPFPTDALPPTIRAAVEEAKLVVEAPSALNASSALAAASLATQTEFNVERDVGLDGPISLYFITIAESGERKSAVDRLFFKAAREFENAQELEAGMMERLQLLYSNTTPMAFIEGLKESSHSACLCEAEGERFFKSKIIDDLGLLNQAWGGDPIVVNRRNKRIAIPSPRCTLSILVQSIVFEKTMRNRGDEFQGIGFNARCLISYPESTQGYRLRKYRPRDLPNIGRFNARSLELFNKQVPLFKSKAHRPERTQLTFSTLAQAEWEHIYEWIERACRAGGIFFRNRDYASKMAENIARMAAVFHAFEGCEGTQISHEHLVSAARIVSWYANEFLRLFSPPSPAEIMINNARTLDAWLIDYLRETNTLYVPKSYLLTSGPNRLKKADLLEPALQKLIDANRLSYFIGFPGLDLLDPTLQELIEANRQGYFLGHPGLNNSRKKKGTLMLLLHDNYYGQIVRGNAPFNFKPL